jgi:hypothetical protein
MAPELDQQMTCPSRSVIVMMVLLKVDCTWATPVGMFFFSFFFLEDLPLRSFAISFVLSGLTGLLLLADGRPSPAAPGPGVGVSSLPPHRQAPAVSQAPIASDVHQPLDIEGDLLAQFTFDLEILVNGVADAADLVFREVLDPRVTADVGQVENLSRSGTTDPEDVTQGDLHPLFPRQVNACNSSQ